MQLGLLVLTTNKLQFLSEHAGLIADAIERIGHGSCEVVTLPRPPRRRRPSTPSPMPPRKP